MKLFVKQFGVVFLTISFLVSCTNVDIVRNEMIESTTIKFGETISIFKNMDNADADVYVIPDIEFTLSSSNENVIKIENEEDLHAVGIGESIIKIRNREGGEIKTISITVVPNIEVTLTSGTAIPLNNFQEGIDYLNYFSEDSEVGTVGVNNHQTCILSGKPGETYIYATRTAFSKEKIYMIKVTVEGYKGESPFEIPAVRRGMLIQEVKQIMKGYNIIVEKNEVKHRIKYYTQLTYSPFGSSERITFWFTHSYISGTDSLQEISVSTNSASNTLKYLLSNYSCCSSTYLSNLLVNVFYGSNYTYFETSNWKISAGNYDIGIGQDNGIEAWSIVDLY